MSKKALKCKNIYTGVSSDLIDGIVILEDERIAFIGDEEDGGEYIDDQTMVWDFSEAFIMPGLHDFHVHLITGAAIEKDGVLRFANSEEAAARALWEKHKAEKSTDWILGGAWDSILWSGKELPKKETLDQYFPDRPVFLLNKECHGAWVNSKALSIMGITKDTPDPVNGSYSRLEDGTLAGYLHETAALTVQEKIYESMSDSCLSEYAEAFVKSANRCGITSLGDVAGGAPIRENAYKILEEQGKLTARIHFYPYFNEGVESISRKKEIYNSQRLQCRGAKTFIDGTPQGHSGYMLQPYTDMPDCCSGPMIEPDLFKRQVASFDKAGIQVRLHACGDAGVKLCLDAIEEAQQKNGGKSVRHCIEHLESVDPSDIPRFGKLGVIASVQPEHLPKYNFYDHPFHRILGEDRMKYCWPFESIRAAGGKLAFGTDSPVAELFPFKGIYRAVNRMTNQDEPENGWNPQEKVSVHEALKAYTYGGAYGAGREHQLGTIEKGKLADLAIVDVNPFDNVLDRESMFNTKVLMTIMNGEIVYEIGD